MNYPTLWKVVVFATGQFLLPQVFGAQPSRTAGGSYTVKQGDTFAKIARSKGVSLDALLKANRVTNPDHILLGQQILIPGSGKPAPSIAPPGKTPPPVPAPDTVVNVSPPAAPGTCVVQSGDSLIKIQRRTGVPAPEIARLNGLTGTSTIRAGQTLRLPSSPLPPPASPPKKSARGTAPHTVQKGETFASISRLYGLKSTRLAAANQSVDPAKKLKTGQILHIPGQPVRTPAQPVSVAAAGQSLTGHSNPAGDTGAPPPSGRSRTGYLVQEGETLAEIAARFRCGEQEIRQLNRMSASDNVYPRRYLLVPFNHEAPLPGQFSAGDT